jgi:hypothetical protein
MKLLTLRLPGWNLEHIATELRLGQLVQQLTEDLGADIARRHKRGLSPAPSALGINEPWERTLRLLKHVREVIRNDLEAGHPGSEGYGDVTQSLFTEANEAFWYDVLDENMWNFDGDTTNLDMA